MNDDDGSWLVGRCWQVSRHAPVGYVISRVFAHDADFAANARLRYRLVTAAPAAAAGGGAGGEGGERPLFDVDPDLGAVSVIGDLVAAELDRYELTVSVADAGVPPRSTTATLSVRLVETAWTDPRDALQAGRRARTGVADVLVEHRVVLVVLAGVTVALSLLLVLAIACVGCRQVRADVIERLIDSAVL